MKNIFLIIVSILLMNIATAERIKPILKKDRILSNAFMTYHDRLGDSISNITIQNTSGAQTFTITGIFIQQLFQADCSTSYYDNHGKLYGVMWSNDIIFNPSDSTPLGAGYLYSMVMNYLYAAASTMGVTPTTPGTGNGTVGTRAWCIQLGILQGAPPQSTTSSVITITTPSSTLSNVVTWASSTNPTKIAITCNDGSQQCTVATATIQGFPA